MVDLWSGKLKPTTRSLTRHAAEKQQRFHPILANVSVLGRVGSQQRRSGGVLPAENAIYLTLQLQRLKHA